LRFIYHILWKPQGTLKINLFEANQIMGVFRLLLRGGRSSKYFLAPSLQRGLTFTEGGHKYLLDKGGPKFCQFLVIAALEPFLDRIVYSFHIAIDVKTIIIRHVLNNKYDQLLSFLRYNCYLRVNCTLLFKLSTG
jgi:hypothetical protein